METLRGCVRCLPTVISTTNRCSSPEHYGIAFGDGDKIEGVFRDGVPVFDVVEVQTGEEGYAVRVATFRTCRRCGSAELELWVTADAKWSIVLAPVTSPITTRSSKTLTLAGTLSSPSSTYLSISYPVMNAHVYRTGSRLFWKQPVWR